MNLVRANRIPTDDLPLPSARSGTLELTTCYCISMRERSRMRDDGRSTTANRSRTVPRRTLIPSFPAPGCTRINGPRCWAFPHMLAIFFILMAWCRVAPGETSRGLVQAGKPEGPQTPVDLYGDRLPAGALARMGTLRFWLGVPISSIAFSPEGENLAAASAGHGITLRVWDTSAGRTVHVLPDPENALPAGDGVREVTFASNGKSLAAACDDGCVRIWEWPSGAWRAF